MQQMVACPNCGSQNVANQQFCVSCGSHLANTQQAVSHTPIVTGIANPSPVVTGLPVKPVVTGAVMSSSVQQQQRFVEVKPTWGLAWGLFWRMIFLSGLVSVVVLLGYMVVRLILGYNDVLGPW